MKKILTISLLLLSCGFARAQWQFQQTDFAHALDSAYYIVADTAGVTPLNAGASQAWDYAFLTPSGSGVTMRYKAPNVVPGVGSPPAGATVAYNPSNADYMFYNLGADSLWMVGEKSDANTFCDYTSSTYANSNPLVALTFPFSFTDFIIDSINAKYADGFISFVIRRGEVTTEYDAWGTVTTPTATYSNTLRIHRIWNTIDSSLTGLATAISQVHEYLWYEQGTRLPVMRIWDQVTDLNSSIQIFKEVWYTATFPVSINPTTNNDRISVAAFPNPSVDELNVQYLIGQNANVNVEILSVDGKTIMSSSEGPKSPGSYSLNLNVQTLAAGTYTVQITAGENKVSRKFVVQ